MICWQLSQTDAIGEDIHIPQEDRARLCPVTQQQKNWYARTLVRQIQHKATFTYHRKIMRRCIQSHTVAKNTICYKECWSDKYNRKQQPHTTNESCEAMASHTRTRVKKKWYATRKTNETDTTGNNIYIPQENRARLCLATHNNKKYDMLRGTLIRQIQHHTTFTYHRRVVRRYVQSHTLI